MKPLIPADVIRKGFPEIRSLRQSNGKTYDLGGAKRLLVKTLFPVHYAPTAGAPLEETDLTPVDLGDRWRIDKAPYAVEVFKDRPAIVYTSNRGGTATIELEAIDGRPLHSLPVNINPVVMGDRIGFGDILPGLDIVLHLRPQKVEWFKFIKDASASRDFTWKIVEDKDAAFTIQTDVQGQDTKDHKAEMVVTSSVVVEEGNRKSYSVRERFTGRVSVIRDRRTRRKEWTDDVDYPVTIDASISEEVTVEEDDGYSYGTNLNLAKRNIEMGYTTGPSISYFGGIRFQTIGIPKDATIDSAVLKTVSVSESNAPVIKMYGDDVDDAPAWATTSRIQNITKTTASATMSNATTTPGFITHDIKSVIQELVNRGGWVSSNDMRFGFFSAATHSTFRTLRFAAYEHPSYNSPVLEVTYTAVGGQTIAVGLASETDTALAVGRLKTATVGLALESDLGLTVGRRKTKPIGLSLETDLGLAVGRLKTEFLGLALESDIAFAVVVDVTLVATSEVPQVFAPAMAGIYGVAQGPMGPDVLVN